MGNLSQPIRSTTQIWVAKRHQYGISVLVSQTSFGGETSGGVTKCRLFSQARQVNKNQIQENIAKSVQCPGQTQQVSLK